MNLRTSSTISECCDLFESFSFFFARFVWETNNFVRLGKNRNRFVFWLNQRILARDGCKHLATQNAFTFTSRKKTILIFHRLSEYVFIGPLMATVHWTHFKLGSLLFYSPQTTSMSLQFLSWDFFFIDI